MIVPATSDKAFFCIDVYRDGIVGPYSTGATNRQAAQIEIEGLGRTGNFELIELYAWQDDVTEWGDPIEEYEPGDFEQGRES